MMLRHSPQELAMFSRSTFTRIARAPEAVLTMSFAGILLAYVAAASAFA